ncbi:MAG: Ig-like domain-containing protein, partial [Hyphomicrobiaceae bacterium]
DAAGVVTFDPDGDFEDLAVGATRDTTLTYEISDGNGGTDTATITVTVTGVNDAPTATDDAFTGVTEDDGAAVIGNALTADNGSGIDSDPDGDALMVTAQTGVAGSNGGTFSIDAAGVVTFDPDGDFEDLAVGATRDTTLTYEISDGNGGTDTATITVTVTGVNDAPTATDDAFTGVTEDDGAAILGNALAADNGSGIDSDPDGDALMVTAQTGVAGSNGGTFSIDAAGVVTFDPDGDFEDLAVGATRDTTLTYEISDGNGGTDTATITVTVTGVNDAPTAVTNGFTTPEDTTSAPIDLLGNDTDPDGDTLTLTSINGVAITAGTPASVSVTADGNPVTPMNPIVGTVEVSVGGVVTFVPALNYAGPVVFDYSISDSNGGTDSVSVTGNVGGTNDAPTATDDAFTGVTEDDGAAVIGNALTADNGSGIDSDPDGDALMVTAQTGVAGSNGGTFSIDAAGVVTFDPDGDFEDLAVGATRDTTLTYEISDGNGGTDTATITVTVTGVNDAPTATDDAFAGVTEDDGAAVIGNALTADNGSGIDSDPDGDALMVTAQTGVAGSNGGTFSIDAAGVVTFDPDGDFEDLAVGATRDTTLTYE